MKNIVLKYGTISGTLMAILILICMPLSPQIGFYNANTILFIGKIAAFIPIYFGMKAYGQILENGYMSYKQALGVGLLITVIVSLFYAISTIVVYFWISPDLPDKVANFIIITMKSQGASIDDIVHTQNMINEAKNAPKSPFVAGAIAIIEIIPYGLIISLILAAFTRKKPPTLGLGNMN